MKCGPEYIAKEFVVCQHNAMRTKLFLIAGVIGIAVIGGVIESLATPRERAVKREEEQAGEKEDLSDEKAGLPSVQS